MSINTRPTGYHPSLRSFYEELHPFSIVEEWTGFQHYFDLLATRAAVLGDEDKTIALKLLTDFVRDHFGQRIIPTDTKLDINRWTSLLTPSNPSSQKAQNAYSSIFPGESAHQPLENSEMRKKDLS